MSCHCRTNEAVDFNGITSNIFHLNIKSLSSVCPPSLLELSLPKFSMSSTTDMRDLLTNISPELEAKLLGSEAEFSQLSNTQPFAIDKVK